MGIYMEFKRFTSDYTKNGYFVIESAFSEIDIIEMRERLESIVSADVVLSGRRFQTDTESGLYEDVEKIELGYRGPQSRYRKISDLEYDEIFLSKLKSNWIKGLCEHFLGPQTSIMRVTMMNKPIGGGTVLPWHQDVAKHWPTSVQPELVIWFPLDHSDDQSGALQVIPHSHKHGMIADGHMLPSEVEHIYAPQSEIKTIVINPGDVLVFNPALLHRSGINHSNNQRRAINVVLMPGKVFHTRHKVYYPVLFGEDELVPNEVSKLTSIPNI